jgi:diaminopimelate epimerase
MKFTKMHGCGNDYIYIDLNQEKIEDQGGLSLMLSDRHFGVGADGIIYIAPSEVADARMIMYNADGSRGKMCGNGIRCVAKYVYDNGISKNNPMTIETDSGIKSLELKINDGEVSKVKVNMGKPELKPELIPIKAAGDTFINQDIVVAGKTYKATCVSMGNPHCVIVMDDIENLELENIGPAFENHEMFPERINTEFIEINSRKSINFRVWERGSGETLACGTGACAAVVACVLNGLTENKVKVHLLGGELTIEYDQENDTVYMTGAATTVFQGEI